MTLTKASNFITNLTQEPGIWYPKGKKKKSNQDLRGSKNKNSLKKRVFCIKQETESILDNVGRSRETTFTRANKRVKNKKGK